MTAEQIMDEVRDYLDRNDWKYDFEAARNIIRTGLSISGKLGSINLILVGRDNDLSVFAVSPLKVDESERQNVAEFITRANYGLRVGNFEMDFSDGDLRYKVRQNLDGRDQLPEGVIEESIFIPSQMFKKYGDGLVKVMMGFCDNIEEEVRTIENA